MIKKKNTVIKFIIILFIFSYVYAETISKIKLYDINNNKYISALEYADAQKIRTIFYDKMDFNELLWNGFMQT